MNAPRVEKRDLHGWLILDKEVGQTSTAAVAALKRLFRAKKVGHAGTLDPLASGVLPIAFGEATKTTSFVMEGRKAYRFTVRWGEETDTDDCEGRPLSQTASRPSPEGVRRLLPSFTGRIEQTPPRFSALKIEGERAYNLARDGEDVSLAPRPVEVHRLDLIETPDADHAVFETECGKGTYVRALARDMGRALGCLGHVSELRRTQVGSFGEQEALRFPELERRVRSGDADLAAALLPVESGLEAVPALQVSRSDADRLTLGQSVLLRGRDAPLLEGMVAVSTHGFLVALAEISQGALKPRRIFNLPR
ncbi:MAG TPA: tRNA pseudouridine(55) synthase TruB [Xanthobacteraceae bacterium]|nr:tRNA pseudouridine(55) synthase TruB [Xanthobacteraceae bacterium]